MKKIVALLILLLMLAVPVAAASDEREAVSYTHLDVYKRQLFVRVVYTIDFIIGFS